MYIFGFKSVALCQLKKKVNKKQENIKKSNKAYAIFIHFRILQQTLNKLKNIYLYQTKQKQRQQQRQQPMNNINITKNIEKKTKTSTEIYMAIRIYKIDKFYVECQKKFELAAMQIF